MPPPERDDRIGMWTSHVHGIASHLTVSSSLTMSAEDLAKREKSALGADELVVDRGEHGLRVWGIVPAADTVWSVHVPFQVPSRMRSSALGPSLELLLSTISVDCRARGGVDGFGESTIEGMTAYDGSDAIASFSTPGWRGGRRTFRLESLQPVRAGLDVVYRLGTPLGFPAAFEIRSTSVTLARAWMLPNPGDVLGRLGSRLRSR